MKNIVSEFSVSFRSATKLSMNLLPAMAKRKHGRVVFMLSYIVLNQSSIKFITPYTCVKYALLGLTKTLSAEYADKGITVNGVSPSMIEKNVLSNIPGFVIQKSADESPLRRNLSVDDVISVFEFLLSDEAACVTGQNIAVTGGN